MSQSQSSQSAKKKQDEKNSKIIRELAMLPENRNCVECGTRGPTYVNITEGSFCCTSCSGLLRGLNPPHRVKSISMATFSNEEVEKVRSMGNAANARTWLGLHSGPIPTHKDADFASYLSKKYEKKQWYVSKDELERQQRLMNSHSRPQSTQSGSSIASTPQATQPQAPAVDLFAVDPFGTFSPRPNPEPPKVVQQTPPPAYQLPQAPPQFPTRFDDAFGPLAPRAPASIPVAHVAPAPHAAPAPTRSDPFADFEKQFNNLSVTSSNTFAAAPQNNGHGVIPKSATVGEAFGIGSYSYTSPAQVPPVTTPANATFGTPSIYPTIQPAFQTPPTAIHPQNVAPVPPAPAATSIAATPPDSKPRAEPEDKYSALAELDQIFHHPVPSTKSTATVPPISKPLTGWTSTGFSAPPLQPAPAFPMPKSNTMGAFGESPPSSFPLPSQPAFPTAAPVYGAPGFGAPQPVYSHQPSAWMPTTQPMQPSIPNNYTGATAPVGPSDQRWNPFL